MLKFLVLIHPTNHTLLGSTPLSSNFLNGYVRLKGYFIAFLQIEGSVAKVFFSFYYGLNERVRWIFVYTQPF